MDSFRIWAILVIKLISVVLLVSAYDPATCIQCRKSHVCQPPDCFCCRDTMPLETHNIPQMVFFTFDDAVNPAVAKHYKDLFDSTRLNPNGCPIRMTLFISHRNTVYSYVREFYEKGMEIASHSVTHSHPNSHTFLREAKKQKENLARKAKIPENEIVGWRSPFLEPLGDTQPTVLKELGYKYDATLTITKKGSNDKAITPFTLDHGWPYDCKIKPCPANPHKGFWEVPVVSVKDYKNKYNCVYIDACHSPPPSEHTAYQFLWDNFQRYYSTNRAPMGINMHASWFYYPDRKAAMDKFIKQLVKMDDVYILTIKQVIDWLKAPTPLNQIKSFQPWQCSGSGNETIGVTETTQILPNKQQSIKVLQKQRQYTSQPTKTNGQTQQNNWRLQQRNQIQANAFSKQPVRPTVVPYRTAPRRETPAWSQTNMNSVPPLAPMAQNFPVRFWWRPPAVMNPQMQIEMQRREAFQRQRMMQEQQRRQMILRQEMLQQQRQNMLLQKQTEKDRIQKEQIEKQRRDDRRREQLLKQKQLEMKLMEEKKRQERLRQEQIEKQKQEELKRQELVKQQQIEQQMIEEKLREERIKQEQLEKQRQEQLRQKEIQQQLEKQRLEEKLHQERLQQQVELQRQEQVKQQQQLEKQRLEEIQQKKRLEKQRKDEMRRQKLLQKQEIVKQIPDPASNKQNKSLPTGPNSTKGHNTTRAFTDRTLSKKLDEILSFNKKDRINMLQQMSLYELQLLQFEVNRRMSKIPTSTRSDNPLFAMKKKVKQDVSGMVKIVSRQRSVDQELMPKSTQLRKNNIELNNRITAESEQDIYSVTHLITEAITQTKTPIDVRADFTYTTTLRPETTTENIKQMPQQQTSSSTHPTLDMELITVTEKPKPKILQETIPIQYGSPTTSGPIDTFEKNINKLHDVPFFNFIPPKLSSFDHQPLVSAPSSTEIITRKPVWQMDKFDIKNLNGPWKRQKVPPSTSPKPTPKKAVRRTSLKILPVAITLFNTGSSQPRSHLSYKAFVRPNLFSPENGNGINDFTNQAVPVSVKRSKPAQIFNTQRTIKYPESVSIFPTEFKRNKADAQSTFIKATTPTTTPTTTTTAAATTTATTSATTTTSTPTTTTITSTTVSTTTTASTTPVQITTMTASPEVNFARQVSSGPLAPSQQRQGSFRTLVPILSHWQLDGPMAIPPYRSSLNPTGRVQSRTEEPGCKQGENCLLPNCFCKVDSVPLGMGSKDVPQVVYITIDGSLNFHSLAKIRKLFSRRRNPNGCKVKGTLFITDAGSSYRIANLLLNDGLELAMMGMSSRPYTNKELLKSDVLLQRQRIAESCNLPEESIHGWRSPGFKTLGDDQFSFLNNESFYDSSILLDDRSSSTEPKLWPFTLDYGLNERCAIAPCLNKRHPGLWEIPVIPYTSPDNSTTCEYIDSCTVQPKTAESTFNYLMRNFNMYYKKNRAPFAIRLKQIWFHWYYRENLKGLFKFLDTVLGYGDVYASSISDMLKWIKSSVKLQNIDTFKPWKC